MDAFRIHISQEKFHFCQSTTLDGRQSFWKEGLFRSPGSCIFRTTLRLTELRDNFLHFSFINQVVYLSQLAMNYDRWALAGYTPGNSHRFRLLIARSSQLTVKALTLLHTFIWKVSQLPCVCRPRVNILCKSVRGRIYGRFYFPVRYAILLTEAGDFNISWECVKHSVLFT